MKDAANFSENEMRRRVCIYIMTWFCHASVLSECLQTSLDLSVDVMPYAFFHLCISFLALCCVSSSHSSGSQFSILFLFFVYIFSVYAPPSQTLLFWNVVLILSPDLFILLVVT